MKMLNLYEKTTGKAFSISPRVIAAVEECEDSLGCKIVLTLPVTSIIEGNQVTIVYAGHEVTASQAEVNDMLNHA